MSEEDQNAISAYKNGEANALEPIIEKYKRPLFSFILKMSEGREDADEIFQEVWFRAIKNIHRFHTGNFLSWLFRIAHNLMIDRARRGWRSVSLQQQRSNDPDSPSYEDQLPASGITPAEEAAGHDIGLRIEAAIDRLAPEQKEVFLMRTYADTPFKEIAKLQRCSINTCLARMQYAVSKLRSLLEADYNSIKESSREL
ncbi:MAG: sigma-70 family RNA polymerase sigma factor [Kiritimatiellaceae bacterium]|nr:MAG: sigma-70 family RNA polymerase sigma factor [Kiritimatiellaceae bacterium]|tara:strand:- start:2431 stop:3027 length:597 start_codon:yes stop_codon:yes gene_type:complete